MFKSSKISNTEDNYLAQSNCVYKYTCPACNEIYIGSTTRHLLTRASEHKRDSLGSHHNGCSGITDFYTSFSIIRNHITTYKKLRATEAIYIKTHNPSLNTMHNTKQRKNFILKL